MNTYRVWNIDTGVCWASEGRGLSPRDAFEGIVSEWGDRPRYGRFLVAKIDAGDAGNHHEYGVFDYAPPPAPAAVITEVEL